LVVAAFVFSVKMLAWRDHTAHNHREAVTNEPSECDESEPRLYGVLSKWPTLEKSVPASGSGSLILLAFTMKHNQNGRPLPLVLRLQIATSNPSLRRGWNRQRLVFVMWKYPES
jgi:hypothetical protein